MEPIFDHEKLDLRVTKSDRIRPGKELLVVAMLTRLVERAAPDEFRVREDGINA